MSHRTIQKTLHGVEETRVYEKRRPPLGRGAKLHGALEQRRKSHTLQTYGKTRPNSVPTGFWVGLVAERIQIAGPTAGNGRIDMSDKPPPSLWPAKRVTGIAVELDCERVTTYQAHAMPYR